ncbi:restriction endonuclease subunit S [Salmonella enterica subsp. enterica serovar Tees]|nr:restriction endonuclease subunit S [Salmonella enterica subsp. enterica serovar Tees]EBY6556413.1 restriction endonuclease subunit S [Salmonella enterica subsp. enterica serovar Tees]ECB6715178.1 restriction endonuclease subunit S [Salmonella enterica subsp. enterica serovar Tees]EEN6515624.1 restriction endonuclease subunit S [Salmonella enterica subsp. enterica serovar Tees]EKL5340943.1 restriction endonuclease subunit S [Salmonella enterica]
MAVEKLIVDHIDTWTTALQTRSTAGRGGSGKIDLYGIKKLRELILELAVRGKLVPQDPNDEPASELLKRIAAEKAELVKQGKIKKQKPLPEISEEEKPFELPAGWEWARLGVLCKKLTDGSHNPPKDAGNGYPMLSSQNIQDGYIDIENPSRYVSEDDFEKENARTLVQKNDVLLTIVGSIGRSAVVLDDKSFVLQRSVAVIDTSLYSHFLSNFFKAITAQNYFIENGKGTAQKGIYLGQLSLMLIPVPSLGEQKRISDRLNELMILCDQLEQHSLTSLDAHQQLVETLLTTLTDGQNADELAENWARISEHFDTLFTTEASIDALKQTILQLAVMGKLVPQDPNDEPASELLKRIAQEKAQLVKDGKIKKQKSMLPASNNKKEFEIPMNWVWTTLPELGAQFQNGLSSRGSTSGESTIVIRLADIQNGEISHNNMRELKITKEMQEKYKLSENDILIIRVNGSSDIVGRFILNQESLSYCYCDHFIRMNFSCTKAINENYLKNIANSPFIRKKIEELFITTAGQKTVNQTHISSLPIPLPPYNEQERINSRINNLFIILEGLRTNLKSAQQTQLHLADALTDAAIN